MDSLYGQLDLTVLGKIVRQHPELIKKVTFKDGEHQLINIDVFERKQTDQYGNVAAIKASCKQEQQKQGLSYFLASLKVSQYQHGSNQQTQQPARQQQQSGDDSDLPF